MEGRSRGQRRLTTMSQKGPKELSYRFPTEVQNPYIQLNPVKQKNLDRITTGPGSSILFT